jgi:hypothetical protein
LARIVLTAEDDIVTGPLGPSVVDDTVDERVDHCAVLATFASVGSECGRSSIGDVGGRDDTHLTTGEAREHLKDRLELGVVERIG